MVTFNLLMSALTIHIAHSQTVQTEPSNVPSPGTFVKPGIPIAALPISITAAGYYYFIANMYFTPTSYSNSVAIKVNSPGAVTIDLKGYSLTGPPLDYVGPPYYYLNPVGITIESSNVTVKNGTIVGFLYSLEVGGSAYLTNIYVKSVNFTGGSYSLSLIDSNDSIVSNCNFTAPFASLARAITDEGSQTGNRYIDDTFKGYSIQIDSEAPMILNINPQTTPR